MTNNIDIAENLLSLDLDFFKLNFLYESVDKIYDIKFKEYIFNEKTDDDYFYTEGWKQKQKKIEKQKNDMKQIKKDKTEKKTNILKRMVDRILQFIRGIKEKIVNAFNRKREEKVLKFLMMMEKLDQDVELDIDIDDYEEELKILLDEQKEIQKELNKAQKGKLSHSDAEKVKKNRDRTSEKIRKLRNKVDKGVSTADDVIHIAKTVAKVVVGAGIAIKFWKFLKNSVNNVQNQENYFENFQNNFTGSENNSTNDDWQSVFNAAQQNCSQYSQTVFGAVNAYDKASSQYKDETQVSLNNEILQDAKKVDKANKHHMTELSNKILHANIDELKISQSEYDRIRKQLKAEYADFKTNYKHSLMDTVQVRHKIELLYKQFFKDTDNVSHDELLKMQDSMKDADQLYESLNKKDGRIISTKI